MRQQPLFLPLILACLGCQHTMHLFVVMAQAWHILHMASYHMLQWLLRSCLTDGSLASGDSWLSMHQLDKTRAGKSAIIVIVIGLSWEHLANDRSLSPASTDRYSVSVVAGDSHLDS